MTTTHLDEHLRSLPGPHAAFLRRAVPRLAAEEGIVGVAAAGSLVTGGVDEFSDVDLVVACEPSAAAEIAARRERIAAGLGTLLVAFGGEHVGEPRLLICLYGEPLLHVDLKFTSLDDVGARVDDPLVLWQRGNRLQEALAAGEARFPAPDPQWVEDRFWVWIHYAAAKIGRGEIFEACDFLAFLRAQVLGPLALRQRGAPPAGVRKIETAAPQFAAELRRTVSPYDAPACAEAVREAARLYVELRAADSGSLVRRVDAENAALAYLAEVRRRVEQGRP